MIMLYSYPVICWYFRQWPLIASLPLLNITYFSSPSGKDPYITAFLQPARLTIRNIAIAEQRRRQRHFRPLSRLAAK